MCSIVIKHVIYDVIVLNFVPCHRKKERSIIIKNWQSPICARCMAILIGYLSLFIFMYLGISFGTKEIVFALMLQIPMLIDGVVQHKGWQKSTNGRRITTGLLSGIGQSLCIVSIVNILVGIII